MINHFCETNKGEKISKNLAYRILRNIVVNAHVTYLNEYAKTSFLGKLKFRNYLLIVLEVLFVPIIPFFVFY